MNIILNCKHQKYLNFCLIEHILIATVNFLTILVKVMHDWVGGWGAIVLYIVSHTSCNCIATIIIFRLESNW